MSTHNHRLKFPLLAYCAIMAAAQLLPAAAPRPAAAADAKLVPACELKEEFNDNIFLAPGNGKADFITTVSPSLAFTRNSERLKIDLLSGISWHDYARSQGIGATDYRYAAGLGGKFSERAGFGINGAFTRTTRPDAIDQTTGLSATTASDRHEYSASVSREMSEATSATLGYSFVKNSYDSPALQGNDVHGASLVLARNLDRVLPQLKGSLSTAFSRASYRDSRSDKYSVTLGASRNFSQTVSMTVAVGGQFIRSTFTAGPASSNESWEAVGSASLTHTGEKSFGSLSFARDFTPASGQVGAVETTSLGVALGRNLTDKTTGKIGASYRINQASSGQFSSQGTDYRALNVTADLVYALSKFFDIGVNYGYYAITHDTGSSSRVGQNSVMVKVAMKYPFTP